MTVELTRRWFLGGTLSVVGAVAATKILPAIPKIVGDGIHDDTAGLNALLAGEPVSISNECAGLLEHSRPIINGGLYRIRRTILIKQPHSLIRNSRFIYNANDFDDDSRLEFTPTSHHCLVENCSLMSEQWLKKEEAGR